MIVCKIDSTPDRLRSLQQGVSGNSKRTSVHSGMTNLERALCPDNGEQDQVPASLLPRAKSPWSILDDPARAWTSAEQIVG